MRARVGREQLLDHATALFRAKGYSATGIDEIVKACGVTKGSLYHHFESKEALALAAMDRVHSWFDDNVFIHLEKPEPPTAEDLQRFDDAVEGFFLAHPDGCLLANLSLEIGVSSPTFGQRIRRFFDDWRRCYVRAFASGRDPGTAEALAEDALAAVHGAVLLHRIDGNIEPLRRQHGRMIATLR